MPTRNILIIYESRRSPMRASQRDHLWSFRRYARDCRCFYVNVAFAPPPEYLRHIDFDLVIFDWLFVGTRVDRDWFTRRVRQMSWLKDAPATKVVLPQDEFISMDLLCDLIREFGVAHVFSVAPASEWPKLYRTVDPAQVRFHRVLTGYLDEHVVRKVARRWRDSSLRRIDIGYRTVSTAIWGRFNLLKKEIGERFRAAAAAHGLTADIRIGAEHFLLGDEWLRFLLRCKYTLGVEGGSSLLDWDGSLFAKISKYLASHPQASFDELEGPCIPLGRDGEISVTAISPRNLEACMTGTCQVLLEGEYNGILLPGVHYIAVKKDYSNLDSVMTTMKDEQARQSIVARAYQDIVASGAWTYGRFVQDVLDASLAGKPATMRSWPARCLSAAMHAWITVRDVAHWTFIFMYSRLRDLRNRYRGGMQHARAA